MSMTDAMNEGRVIMDFVSKKKIREERNSYGLITIKITKVSALLERSTTEVSIVILVVSVADAAVLVSALGFFFHQNKTSAF